MWACFYRALESRLDEGLTIGNLVRASLHTPFLVGNRCFLALYHALLRNILSEERHLGQELVAVMAKGSLKKN